MGFINNDNDVTKNGKEVDYNKINRENFENLMKDSETNKDEYWDSNNLLVRLVLFILGLIIVAGATYYILGFFS